jgi:hypothetical protein
LNTSSEKHKPTHLEVKFKKESGEFLAITTSKTTQCISAQELSALYVTYGKPCFKNYWYKRSWAYIANKIKRKSS